MSAKVFREIIIILPDKVLLVSRKRLENSHLIDRELFKFLIRCQECNRVKKLTTRLRSVEKYTLEKI